MNEANVKDNYYDDLEAQMDALLSDFDNDMYWLSKKLIFYMEDFINQEIVMIDAPTGAGKSHFIFNEFYEYCKKNNYKILYFVPRAKTKEQFQKENKWKKDIVTIMSYQTLEQYPDFNMDKYTFIVADEAHYFLADSKFNENTCVSFDAIMASQAHKIFMTATAEKITDYLENILHLEVDVYRFEKDDDNVIDSLTFYSERTSMEELMQIAYRENHKTIFFINNLDLAYKLYRRYKDKAIFNCSQFNKKHKKHISKDAMKYIVENRKFPDGKYILITSTALDCGFNIRDAEMNTIVIYSITDVDTIVQCVGRKRQDENSKHDKINLYIKDYTNAQLRGRKSAFERLKNLAQKIENNTNITKKTDIQQIFNSTVFRNDISGNHMDIKINPLALQKVKYDIAELQAIMEIDMDAMDRYLCEKLNCDDFDLYEEQNADLKRYLEGYVGVVMLTAKDREPFLQGLQIKRKSKPLRSLTTLNSAFEFEYKIPYRIEEFSTHRTVLVDGEKKRKPFQHAWRIIKLTGEND